MWGENDSLARLICLKERSTRSGDRFTKYRSLEHNLTVGVIRAVGYVVNNGSDTKDTRRKCLEEVRRKGNECLLYIKFTEYCGVEVYIGNQYKNHIICKWQNVSLIDIRQCYWWLFNY